MKIAMLQCVSAAAMACALSCLSIAISPGASAETQAAKTPERDGQHDFDFDVGIWHTHIKRVLDPLSGSAESVELDGTVTVRKVWDGLAQLEEIEVDGPSGHWEGLNLFLYNPAAHQWSQSFSNSKSGVLGSPMIGSFKDGRAQLIAPDTINNKAVLVRAAWSDIKRDSHRYEEFYSDDGGKTWALSFTANLTRHQ